MAIALTDQPLNIQSRHPRLPTIWQGHVHVRTRRKTSGCPWLSSALCTHILRSFTAYRGGDHRVSEVHEREQGVWREYGHSVGATRTEQSHDDNDICVQLSPCYDTRESIGGLEPFGKYEESVTCMSSSFFSLK